MSEWVGVVTDAGKNAIEAYMAGGATLNFNLVKTGTGSAATEEDMRELTDLVDEVETLESTASIAGVRFEEGGAKFRMQVHPITDSYNLKEIGLYATLGASGSTSTVLVGYYTKSDGITIPKKSDFPDFAYIVTSVISLVNTENLTITVDPDAFVSQSQFQEEVGNLFDKIYPVGSIYMSANNTNPGTLFNGTTWTQIKDRFLLAAGDTYSAGNTGGAATKLYTPAGTVGGHALTEGEIPKHNHTFTGTAVTSGENSRGHTHSVGAHSHGLNNHTHGIPSLSGSTGSSGVAALCHNVKEREDPGYISFKWTAVWENEAAGGTRVVAGSSHSHTVSTNASTTGGASGSTANSSAFTSGGESQNHTHSVTAKGSIGTTGGGEAHSHGFTGTQASIDVMPPYLTVYMWQRTA